MNGNEGCKGEGEVTEKFCNNLDRVYNECILYIVCDRKPESMCWDRQRGDISGVFDVLSESGSEKGLYMGILSTGVYTNVTWWLEVDMEFKLRA